MNEEIKEWQTQSVKHKVAYVLMMDGISFRYTEETEMCIRDRTGLRLH